jgi:modulator of FtsH protease HflC
MTRNLIIAGTVLTLLLGSMSVFTVGQSQKAIKFRLGEIVETDFDPGLHFQVPFLNNVKKFDGRLLTLDSTPALFMTSEKKNVNVDYYAKWKIKDVSKFYTSVSGDVAQANLQLDRVVQSALRSQFSTRTIKDVVSEDRAEIRANVIEAANRLVNNEETEEGKSNKLGTSKGLGIEFVDIRIIRIDLPKEVSASVYRRMESERTGVAWSFRARGAEMAERRRAEADREREVILGNAYRDAEIKRGEGDATAADIYSQAYGKDKDFFAFYRSLTAYKQAFKNEGDTIVLDPNSEFFQYFKKSNK